MDRDIFNFARQMKARQPHPSMTELEREFVTWCHEFHPDFDLTTSWTTFLHSFASVRHPEGYGALANAFQHARAKPCSVIGYPANHPIGILTALCRELHGMHQGPFPLSCRIVGKLLNVSYQTANSWMLALQALRVIQCVSSGSYRKKLAAVYSYLPGIPELPPEDESQDPWDDNELLTHDQPTQAIPDEKYEGLENEA